MGVSGDFIPGSKGRVVSSFFDLVATEIYHNYGHKVKIHRKSLHKYGENTAVGTTEELIVPWGVSPDNAYRATTNAVDTMSSSSAADTSVPVYYEAMELQSDGTWKFFSTTQNLDASDGQTKVTLTRPGVRVTRIRTTAVGNVYFYADTAITAGVPNDTNLIHNQSVPDDKTTMTAATSVASNNYFIMTQAWAELGKASGTAAADIRIRVANIGDSVLGDDFYTDEKGTCSLDKEYLHEFFPFKIIKPKSDLVLTATASTGTLDIKAGFRGFFADIIE